MQIAIHRKRDVELGVRVKLGLHQRRDKAGVVVKWTVVIKGQQVDKVDLQRCRRQINVGKVLLARRQRSGQDMSLPLRIELLTELLEQRDKVGTVLGAVRKLPVNIKPIEDPRHRTDWGRNQRLFREARIEDGRQPGGVA